MRRYVTLTIVAFIAVVAAGCASKDTNSGSESKPKKTVSTEQQQTYLTKLAEVHAELAAKKNEAVTKGQQTCEDFTAGLAGDQIATRVKERFTIENKPLNDEQAVQVIDVVHQYLCPAGS